MRSDRDGHATLLEFVGELGGQSWLFFGEVFGFSLWGGVVVEFEVAFCVFDEAVGGGADGAGSVGVGDGLPFRGVFWVFELGEEGLALEESWFF